MKIMPAVEAEIRRTIRDARAKDPIISIVGLQQVLEQRFERTFTRDYIARIDRKVHKEALTRADRTKLNERLNVTREKFRIASERLMQIIDWKPEPQEG